MSRKEYFYFKKQSIRRSKERSQDWWQRRCTGTFG